MAAEGWSDAEFSEIDRAEWFDLPSAHAKILEGQRAFLDQLAEPAMSWDEAGAMTDPFDLQRFLDAQAPVYARVLAGLRRGQKQSHWMWFIFPQLAGF